ncbi:hypothetical protein RMATCC62417_09766 [Rhizopus microsporus]|nr:hypothetical protein RMATCC62417_09766 [Rhizopus microsporus]
MILKLLVGFLFFTLFLIMSHSSRHDCSSSTSSNVIFKPGLLPLVITAPHGGWKKPTTIPDRVKNGSLVLTDLYTAEIAQDIYERIEQHYGHSPHLVVNTISRRKADPNRDIDEGTETEGGRHIWIEYHSRIKDAIEALHRRHSFGLLIDIHGHAHPQGMIELGYLIEPSNMRSSSEILNQVVLKQSSIRSLANRHKSIIEPSKLLKQFGDSMVNYNSNITAVPSTDNFDPEDEYFRGAYTIQTYHYHNDKARQGLDAIQIEIPQRFRLTPENREQLVHSVANAAIQFLDDYYIIKTRL